MVGIAYNLPEWSMDKYREQDYDDTTSRDR